MPAASTIDEKFATELTGQAKLKALVDALFGGWAGYARHRNIWPEHVRMAVGGKPADAVRDMLAEDLGLARAEIDQLIDGEQRPAARSA